MPLYLNALGLATPFGASKAVNAERLLRRASPAFTPRLDPLIGREIQVGAMGYPLLELPREAWRYDCRNNRALLLALSEISAEVDTAIRRYGRARIAVVLGTSTSGIDEAERALAVRLGQGAWPARFTYEMQEMGGIGEFLAEHLRLSGPTFTLATACSSGGKVFASAARLIEAGLCDAALVGGADTLCRLTLNGFNALESLSRGRCNPFSRNRDGINIGEGAALFLLTPKPAEIRLAGVGECSDAYHISAPEPSGAGAHEAMRLALADAGLAPEEIDYLNLHGTATPLNDVMEGLAVARLFPGGVPCSATKAMTGHLLGAAGAVEAAFCWLTLSGYNVEGLLPPHIWDGAQDPAIPALDLVAPGRTMVENRRRHAMSSSFAFGGSNVALVLSREA
ncbi:MAG: beta-ketoacyl-[acyl-carrier-protein] synthase family protein [Alphaproteobacteria bacterium]|nr:beta-ketoacyl-[acyl-carrier-protein] synthase family protein [Alphaproteobacteria bacterium]